MFFLCLRLVSRFIN